MSEVILDLRSTAVVVIDIQKKIVAMLGAALSGRIFSRHGYSSFRRRLPGLRLTGNGAARWIVSGLCEMCVVKIGID